MKKLAFAAALAVAFASCQKDSNDAASVATVQKGTWTVGSTTYHASSWSASDDIFYVYDTTGNGLTFVFDTTIQALASGNYTVVGSPVNGAREVSISAFDQTSGQNTYYATGSDRTVAAITAANGRITAVAVPNTIAARRSKTDSLTISVNVGPF